MGAFNNFYGGDFFDGGFFGGAAPVPPVDETSKTGTGGIDPPRRRGATFKPTGLPPIRRGRKAVPEVEARVAETHEIAKEVALEALAAPPVVTMSAAEIDFEIGKLIRKTMRTEEDEIVLLTLMAAAAAL